MLKQLSKDQKTILTVVFSIILLLIVAFFLLFQMNPLSNSEEPDEIPETPTETVVEDDPLVSEDDFEHHTHEDLPNIFDETDSDQATIDYLRLSKPVKITGAYDLNSKADFLGSFDDERVYVLGHKGQLYHYNLVTKQIYTYENLVEDVRVDSATGNLIYSKFNDGLDPALSFYKIMKEYPEPIKFMEIQDRVELQDFVFINDTFIFSLFNLDKMEPVVYVFPGSTDELNSFGNSLKSQMDSPYSGFSTDGERFIAYSHKDNAVVDLTSGSSDVIHQFDDSVYGIRTGVSKDKVVISGSNEIGSSYFTLVNGSKVADGSYHQITFYDERFAFINDGMQLQLLDTDSSIITAVEQIIPDYSISGNHLYLSNDFGEILKMKIERIQE